MAKRRDTTTFIAKAKAVHGESRFDYSQAEYVNARTHVTIVCAQHGPFRQTPDNHLRGASQCPRCYGRYKTKKEWVRLAREQHGDWYDYAYVSCTKRESKVRIICPDHGEFTQRAGAHLRGQRCKYCAEQENGKAKASNTSEFIRNANEVHGEGTYGYGNVRYERSNDKVEMLCPTHGSFFQSPWFHVGRKQGCPACKATHGERAVANILDALCVTYNRQYRIERGTTSKSFDFAIIGNSLWPVALIEYDGEFHYEPHWRTGIPGLIRQRYRDRLKTQWAADHGIPLLRIPYTQFDQIKSVVRSFIKDITCP